MEWLPPTINAFTQLCKTVGVEATLHFIVLLFIGFGWLRMSNAMSKMSDSLQSLTYKIGVLIGAESMNRCENYRPVVPHETPVQLIEQPKGLKWAL